MAQNTPKGRLIAQIMNQGELVPFDTVLDLILKQINTSPNGFILDGTPRDLSQAEHMDWFLIKITSTLTQLFTTNLMTQLPLTVSPIVPVKKIALTTLPKLIVNVCASTTKKLNPSLTIIKNNTS